MREYKKAIDYLRGMIESGELCAGDRLPTERALSETLAISRNSTREALRMLENMGVIECRRGSGNYLSGDMSGTFYGVIDTMLMLRQTGREDICAFRRAVEKTVCMMACGKQGEWREEAEKLLGGFLEMPPNVQAESDRRFHQLLIKATGNKLMICISEALQEAYRRFTEEILREADEHTKKGLHEAHVRMYEALLRGDRAECEAAIDAHYDIIEEALIRVGRL